MRICLPFAPVKDLFLGFSHVLSAMMARASGHPLSRSLEHETRCAVTGGRLTDQPGAAFGRNQDLFSRHDAKNARRK